MLIKIHTNLFCSFLLKWQCYTKSLTNKNLIKSNSIIFPLACLLSFIAYRITKRWKGFPKSKGKMDMKASSMLLLFILGFLIAISSSWKSKTMAASSTDLPELVPSPVTSAATYIVLTEEPPPNVEAEAFYLQTLSSALGRSLSCFLFPTIFSLFYLPLFFNWNEFIIGLIFFHHFLFFL